MTNIPPGISYHHKFVLDDTGSSVVETYTMDNTIEEFRIISMKVVVSDSTADPLKHTLTLKTINPKNVESINSVSKSDVLLNEEVLFKIGCFKDSTTFKFSVSGSAGESGAILITY